MIEVMKDISITCDASDVAASVAYALSVDIDQTGIYKTSFWRKRTEGQGAERQGNHTISLAFAEGLWREYYSGNQSH